MATKAYKTGPSTPTHAVHYSKKQISLSVTETCCPKAARMPGGSHRDATASSPSWHFTLPPEAPRSQDSHSPDHRFWQILNINRCCPCAVVVLHGELHVQFSISLQYQGGYLSALQLTSTCTVLSCLLFLDTLELGSKLFWTKQLLFFDVDTVWSVKIKRTCGDVGNHKYCLKAFHYFCRCVHSI